uniref:Uncharacterized protein n=1 Tax=Leersia perrieri TaxID=77586 RepID=A0A0D9WGA9_9ORYZ
MPPLASDARACTDRTPTSPTKTGSLQAAPFDCYPLILPLSRSLPQISQIQCSSRPVSTAAGVCVYAAEEVLQRYQIRPVLTRSRPPAGGSGGAAVASLLARLGLAAAMLARLWCCYPLLSPSGIVCRRCSPVPLPASARLAASSLSRVGALLYLRSSFPSISSSKLAVAILSNCTTLVAEQEVLGCEVHQKAQ